MKTIILPGYSPRNKEWAEEVKSRLQLDHEVMVCEWRHWSGGGFSIKYEAEEILKTIGTEKINVIAKSVGTRVLMSLVSKINSQIQKVIVCGIPMDPTKYMKRIKLIGADRLFVIQNEKDPFMPAKAIKLFMKVIDKKIRVIEKPRSDHTYPFFKDFQNFLSSS